MYYTQTAHSTSLQLLTGLQVSSVNAVSALSGRHSKASKYNHCLIGMNFPLQAYKNKQIQTSNK